MTNAMCEALIGLVCKGEPISDDRLPKGEWRAWGFRHAIAVDSCVDGQVLKFRVIAHSKEDAVREEWKPKRSLSWGPPIFVSRSHGTWYHLAWGKGAKAESKAEMSLYDAISLAEILAVNKHQSCDEDLDQMEGVYEKRLDEIEKTRTKQGVTSADTPD